MAIILLAGSVLLLFVLIARFRVNAFFALLITSFLAGAASGMELQRTLASILKGIGDTLGALVLILVFGAVLGKLVEESGAARSVSDALARMLGADRIQISVLLTGMLVGLPMVYNASFLVLIPLIYTISHTRRLPLLYIGIPLSSALSVAHGLLIPHPAPVAIASLLKADPNLTLLYGLVLAGPAAILAGPVLERFCRDVRASPPVGLFRPEESAAGELPSLGASLVVLLSPVGLMVMGAAARLLGDGGGAWSRAALFLSEPTVALFAGVVAAMVLLGLRRGRSMESLMQSAAAAAASVSMVALIIASGGAFKQVLMDAGVADAMQSATQRLGLPPIWLCWLTSALLRLALGSATVAAITSAGIVLPAVTGSGVAPELLVIAIASGSLMFSHFNDIGFWMFKEYYNVSVKDTFRVWTVMESIVAVVGLVGVLALHAVLPSPHGQQARRIFYVNSYHEGYPPSDEAMAAIRERFSSPGFVLGEFFLDAKRRPDESSIRSRAAMAADLIRSFKPEVILVSDDDAVKFVVVPYLKDGPIPVVFCGVNWSAESYGLPRENVTGMVETLPVDDAVALLRRFRPKARRLMVLSEDSTSERNNTRLLDARWRRLGFEPEYALVPEFEEWKRRFAEAQTGVDVLYLPTVGAIRGWDGDQARRWVRRHSRVPSFTCDEFMMDYVAFGVVKVAREQGEWAARSAQRILQGERPSRIPLAENRQSRCLWNEAVAASAGLSLPDVPCASWTRAASRRQARRRRAETCVRRL